MPSIAEDNPYMTGDPPMPHGEFTQPNTQAYSSTKKATDAVNARRFDGQRRANSLMGLLGAGMQVVNAKKRLNLRE